MIPLFTTFSKSLVGKLVVGVSVATMGVGAAAAAGTEMPSFSGDHVGVDDDSGEGTTDISLDESDDESVDEPQDEAPESADGTDDERDEDQADDVESDDHERDVDGRDDGRHGDVVSEFTRGTDLAGCEKGQATAAVARGDVDPSSPTLDDDLAPFISKCGTDDTDTDESDTDDTDTDDSDTDESEPDWKDIRDESRSAWHEAEDAYHAFCDDERGDGSDGGDAPSPECAAMKGELKLLHADAKEQWKDARDAEHAERKSDRAASKASDRADGNRKRKDKD